MRFNDATDLILDELRKTLARISADQAAALVDALLAARAVFIAGAGRSGLAMRAFAMRLMHLGLACHVVGDTTTPNLTAEDLLVIGSGSGATDSLVVHAENARALGARVALITIQPDSPLGRLADPVVTIPAPTPKIPGDTGHRSAQPMGSLFEQCLALILDALILLLMERRGQDPATMFTRHANLE